MSGRLALGGCSRAGRTWGDVTAQERELVGDDALERVADVDVEMPVRVETDLAARRGGGVLLGRSGRRDGVGLADAEQDGAGDVPRLAAGAVAHDLQRETGRELVTERRALRHEREG